MLVRHEGGDDGLVGDTKSFIRVYGRSEALATALAVACGQGLLYMEERLPTLLAKAMATARFSLWKGVQLHMGGLADVAWQRVWKMGGHFHHRESHFACKRE